MRIHCPGVARPLVVLVTACAAMLAACSASDTFDPNTDGRLALGTWGGDSGGFIVSDTAAHLHIACTYGDISGRIAIDANGNFSVPGSYMLRAYPIAVGPSVPAVFTGHASRGTVVVTATVNDTVQHAVVVRGPVTLTFGTDPRLGPCPICRRPVHTKGLWQAVIARL